MTRSPSRREFFKWGGGMLGLGGLACGGNARAARERPLKGSPASVDYYDKLGVTKFINAAGAYTFLSGALMPPSVQAAVAVAAKHPVRLPELQKKAGEYIANRLHCEAALVSDGAASALTLGTAACITGTNQDAILRIPSDMASLKNEVLIQKAHRYGYDHAVRNCGIKFVEVETMEEYEKAFTEKTAMAHFFNAAEGGQIGHEDWLRVAHQHNVPCFNDAAADLPPVSNLWKYTQMGFDLVTFSGGKGIRGPQNAGLLLGRKDLIEAAAANNNPISDTIGRGMKVSREQIVGMVAAIDWYLSQTDEGLERECQRRIGRITSELKGIPTLTCQTFLTPVANRLPHLLIRYDQARVKISPLEVAEKLRKGSPSIELNPSTGSNLPGPGLPTGGSNIVVWVDMLEPGEDSIVARSLRQVLQDSTSKTG